MWIWCLRYNRLLSIWSVKRTGTRFLFHCSGLYREPISTNSSVIVLLALPFPYREQNTSGSSYCSCHSSQWDKCDICVRQMERLPHLGAKTQCWLAAKKLLKTNFNYSIRLGFLFCYFFCLFFMTQALFHRCSERCLWPRWLGSLWAQ